EDHKQLSDQLYYAYAEGKTIQKRAMVSGEKALTTTDKLYLQFMERFETEFISQSFDEKREIEETLDLGWNLLSILPEAELTRIDPDIIEEYHPKQKEDK
ncbi:MAG: V-type ATP synthase subunit B, partial [Thermoproteota archaeon]